MVPDLDEPVVVLGIDDKDTRGCDDDVVDVAVLAGNPAVVEDLEPADAAERLAELLLARGPDGPGTDRLRFVTQLQDPAADSTTPAGPDRYAADSIRAMVLEPAVARS